MGQRIKDILRGDRRHLVFYASVLLLVLLIAGLVVRRFSGPHFGSMPDMSAYSDVSEMKTAFFAYLRPIVEYHNNEIREKRERLLRIYEAYAADEALSGSDRRWLRRLAKRYGVQWQQDDLPPVFEELIERVDIVPPSLASVQAAKESGWGRSRFAVQGNNLFGQWCYNKGCGMVPRNRAAGAGHEVRRFDSVSDAVASYIHNINTHDSYKDLRQIRAALRRQDRRPDGLSLSKGLLMYSERREAYVDEISSMVRQYARFAP